MKNIVYYWDMDGPLAQWDTRATVYDTWQPDYFKNRVVMENSVQAIRLMQKNGICVKVLSSVYNETVADDKIWWLKYKAGLDLPAVFVPYGEDKSKYIEEGEGMFHVLIDDHTPNLNQWKQAGLFGIKFLNSINGTGKNGKNTWTGPIVSERMTPEALCFSVVGTSEYAWGNMNEQKKRIC